MSKHTPGPWHRSYGNYVYQGSDCLTDRKRLIAITEPSTRTQEDWDQVFANARLIAAAPELLEALVGMVEVFGNQPHVLTLNEVIEAKRIIAKAKGEL